MDDENECRIETLRKLSPDSAVYLLQLAPKNGKFEYKGLQHVSQLGQYFVLTINNSKTRLYTSVNCINNSNRALMASIAEEMRDNFGELVLTKKENSSSSAMELNENMKENVK